LEANVGKGRVFGLFGQENEENDLVMKTSGKGGLMASQS
jgi:hypothetical protein